MHLGLLLALTILLTLPRYAFDLFVITAFLQGTHPPALDGVIAPKDTILSPIVLILL